MRIVIFHELVYPYNKGGGEVQRYQIAKHLSACGHDVKLVGYNYPKRPRNEKVDGFEIKRVGPVPVDSPEQHLCRLIDSFGLLAAATVSRYDIMMANPYLSMLSALPLAKIRGKRVAVTWDDIFGFQVFREHKGFFIGMLGSLVEKICLYLTRGADVVFTVSESSKKKLMEHGINGNKIVVMYNGIDTEDYRTAGCRKKKQIVYLGRHVLYKNVGHLLQAFARISGKKKNMHLLILGQGELTESYKKLALELGIDKNVDFRGFVDGSEKARILAESMILVLPSYNEGFGIALIEANICGTPYVAYDIPAVREITGMTHGGILVESGNVDKLSETMENLLNNTEKRKKLAADGRKNVLRNFTWNAVSERVRKAIE